MSPVAEAVIDELDKAHEIIKAMLNLMTAKQKLQLGEQLENNDISYEGITRYHERRVLLDLLKKARAGGEHMGGFLS
jgi:hypothetical protein